jgi:hypothetical protein
VDLQVDRVEDLVLDLFAAPTRKGLGCDVRDVVLRMAVLTSNQSHDRPSENPRRP